MKTVLTKWLPLFLFLMVLGGFAWLAMVDIPVNQVPVEKTIPNSRFFQQ